MATQARPIHLSDQGGCGRHGAEEHVVTPGDRTSGSARQERGAKAGLYVDTAKGRRLSGETSEDGTGPEARAGEPACPWAGRRRAPGKAVREGVGREPGDQRVRP